MENDGTTWINTRQAAARLGVPARDLYRLIDDGRLPAHAVGRDLRLRTDEVESFRVTSSAP